MPYNVIYHGDWGLGPIPNPQSPIPNPQSPFILFLILEHRYKINKIKLLFKLFIKIKK